MLKNHPYGDSQQHATRLWRVVFDTMENPQPSITPERIRIERLQPGHNLTGFQSYEQELVDFLLDDALANQNHHISVTYLWFLNTGELVGYGSVESLARVPESLLFFSSGTVCCPLKGTAFLWRAKKLCFLCITNSILARWPPQKSNGFSGILKIRSGFS